jgi:hypothetical protein
MFLRMLPSLMGSLGRPGVTSLGKKNILIHILEMGRWVTVQGR